MLKSLRLKNFKCWRDTGEIEFGSITGFFGTNSSGKTSILQSLLLLKQTSKSTDTGQALDFGNEDSLAYLGPFSDTVYTRPGEAQSDKGIGFSFSWSLLPALEIKSFEAPEETAFETHEINFDCTFNQVGNVSTGRIIVDEFKYTLKNEFTTRTLGMRKKNANATEYAFEQSGFDLQRIQGLSYEIPSPIKCYRFPQQVTSFYKNAGALSETELSFEHFFESLYYLAPIRDYPKKYYSWGGARPLDVGMWGEATVDALLASEANFPESESDSGISLQMSVALQLQKLGLVEFFEVERISEQSSIYRVMVQRTKNSKKVALTEVGFGVSQILPVITLCYYAPEGSTIILEQPEIHLHPSVQAGLADVLIEVTKTRKIQIILESHSEHLLKRLQRRMAEYDADQIGVSSDCVKLYFCKNEGSESQLEPLQLNEYGYIKNWPEDFFGNDLEESGEMMKAMMRRKLAKKQTEI